jgi:hypothetical protein
MKINLPIPQFHKDKFGNWHAVPPYPHTVKFNLMNPDGSLKDVCIRLNTYASENRERAYQLYFENNRKIVKKALKENSWK